MITRIKSNKGNSATKKNPWKIAFLIVTGIILGASLFLYIRITANREPDLKPRQESVASSKNPTLQVQMKKKDVNEVTSYYLNDFLKDSGVKYNFYLENQALLNGTFKVLGHEVQFYLYFDPFVMENGNVLLNAKSLSIGTLSLPISDIMRYVKNSLDMPKWVEVIPKEQKIILHLDEFTLQNGMYTSAEKINLIDDDIRFNVYLPITDEKKSEEK